MWTGGLQQGDPLGGIQAGAIILEAVERARIELSASGITFSDCWYLDDGQIFCAEEDVDAVLRALDRHFTAAGATRGCGDEVKSVARVPGSCEAGGTGDGADNAWATPYVRAPCQVRDA